ncbi:adenosine deaminase-like [Diadema antillarum]|uniref:adenosine deaminase-like n=1 Tax=Diadema antillarum TaxID=105358 RepID=UPI003A8C4B78
MARGINGKLSSLIALSARGFVRVNQRSSTTQLNVNRHYFLRPMSTSMRERNAAKALCTKDIFPKVQLHIHIDGAVRHETLWRIARKKGIPLPGRTLPEFVETFRNQKRRDFATFLSNFDLILPIIRGDQDVISQVAYELCEDQAREGVRYFEARYCPHFLASPSRSSGDDVIVSPRDVVVAVNDGIRRGCRDYGVKGRTILCMIRAFPEYSQEVIELSKEFFNDTVVGIDLAGDENAPWAREHEDAYRIARELGIHRTVHAGELGPADNVRFAIEQLGAERIGHGYRITENRDVYEMVREKFIHLELCPTSSIQTGAWSGSLEDHCTMKFFKDGLNMGLNTDDPTIFCNTMTCEYQIARDHFGMTDRQLADMTMNAARASFLPEDEKKELVRELQAEFDSRL